MGYNKISFPERLFKPKIVLNNLDNGTRLLNCLFLGIEKTRKKFKFFLLFVKKKKSKIFPIKLIFYKYVCKLFLRRIRMLYRVN